MKTEEKGSEDFNSDPPAFWRLTGVVIVPFIRNPRAVLLLAACPNPEPDRLLSGENPVIK
jgi:hypothetical protein